MLNDLNQDEINSNHPSLTWTNSVIESVTNLLVQHHWKQTMSNKIDHACFTKDRQIIEINLTHLPDDSHINDNIVYISDCVVYRQQWQVVDLWPEVFGVYQHDFVYDTILPDKLFACFIHRGCSFRQSWLYQFIKHNILDSGYVTYWCEDRINGMPPDQYFEILFQENNLLFKEQHQHLLGKIPFKNFDFPIEHAILKSGKNLIIETFQDSVDCVAYSEKTWRSIQLPRPWLLFGPMYSVRHLRQWGFDVFDDYIDHSYDNETSSITRQSMILEQLKMPIIYNEEILKNFESRVQHNRDLLKKLAQAWPSKLKNTLNTLINISSIESSTSRA